MIDSHFGFSKQYHNAAEQSNRHLGYDKLRREPFDGCRSCADVTLQCHGFRRAPASATAAETAAAAQASAAEAEARAEAGGDIEEHWCRWRSHELKPLRSVRVRTIPADTEEHAILYDTTCHSTERNFSHLHRRWGWRRCGSRH